MKSRNVGAKGKDVPDKFVQTAAKFVSPTLVVQLSLP